MGVGGQLHAPAALSLGKRPFTHCTKGWVGPRAGLDGFEGCSVVRILCVRDCAAAELHQQSMVYGARGYGAVLLGTAGDVDDKQRS